MATNEKPPGRRTKGARKNTQKRRKGTSTAADPQVAKVLRERGIPPDVAKWARLEVVDREVIYTITNHAVECDGILIPFYDFQGKPVRYKDRSGGMLHFVRIKLLGHHQPKGEKKPIKYLQPPGSGNHLYVPQVPGLNWPAILKDWETSLFATEGEFKALALAMRGLACVAVTGVDNWRTKEDDEYSPPIVDLNAVNWHKRKTYIAFDSDSDTNSRVHKARFRFGQELARRHAAPLYLRVPSMAGYDKTGIDDWFKARGAKADAEFKALCLSAESPWVLLPKDATEILKMELKPMSYLIDGLLRDEGLIFLAGFQKRGKSYLALDLAIAVARGTKALGHFKVSRQRKVLYVAFEDPVSRMEGRLRQLGFPDQAPPNLKIVFAKEMRQGAEGYAMIERWVEDNAGALVVIDTWQRLRGIRDKGSRSNAYEEDVAHLAPLQEMTHRLHFTILALHHLNKSQSADLFAQVSGSVGITATSDTTLVLEREHQQPRGFLHVQSRDDADEAISLSFDAGKWTYFGAAASVGRTRSQQRIMDVLRMVGQGSALGPSDIAKNLNVTKQSLTRTLRQMVEEGRVLWVDGKYTLINDGAKC